MSENDKEDPSNASIAPSLSENCEDDGVDCDQAGQYTYRDYSHVTKDDDPGLVVDNPPPIPPSRTNLESSIRVQKFPVKLYVILAQKEFHDIISWLPHGRSWKILKPALFESMVMPLFFEYSNYHSFNRLVNAWSFRRISGGPDRGSYYHELFLRGMPHLQKYMRRLPKTHKKLPMCKKDEPDFYALNKTNPLPSLEDAPIPLVSTNTGATMGGSGQSRDSNSIQFANQQQQHVNTSAMQSPTGFQTVATSAVPQMVQRFVSDDIFSASQIHGTVHSGIGQLRMQPMMVSASPGISAPVVQGTNIVYGNLRQQPGMMAPSLINQLQGVDVGYLEGFDGSPIGGTIIGNHYQTYPSSAMALLPAPAQGYEGTFGNGPMRVQQHMSDSIMMRNQLQQQRAFIGIE